MRSAASVGLARPWRSVRGSERDPAGPSVGGEREAGRVLPDVIRRPGSRKRTGRERARRPWTKHDERGPAFQLERLLVHGAMVPAAEQREVVQARGPAIGKVA